MFVFTLVSVSLVLVSPIASVSSLYIVLYALVLRTVIKGRREVDPDSVHLCAEHG